MLLRACKELNLQFASLHVLALVIDPMISALLKVTQLCDALRTDLYEVNRAEADQFVSLHVPVRVACEHKMKSYMSCGYNEMIIAIVFVIFKATSKKPEASRARDLIQLG